MEFATVCAKYASSISDASDVATAKTAYGAGYTVQAVLELKPVQVVSQIVARKCDIAKTNFELGRVARVDRPVKVKKEKVVSPVVVAEATK